LVAYWINGFLIFSRYDERKRRKPMQALNDAELDLVSGGDALNVILTPNAVNVTGSLLNVLPGNGTENIHVKIPGEDFHIHLPGK
jgi:hypothetical protein